MSKLKVIGISGVARAGKDTLAACIKDILLEEGFNVAIYSLATPLKQDLYGFVWDNFGFNVHLCDDEQKSLIRPLMVAYGSAKRKQTKGQYWTSFIDRDIDSGVYDDFDYLIVPDVRYAEYDQDEVFWLKEKMSGSLFFVEKILPNGDILGPPNIDEERNCPILKAAADHVVSWPSMIYDGCLETVKNRNLF